MVVMRCFTVALVAVFCSAASDAGRAAESVRTELDLDKCHHTPGSADEDYGSWLCKGYAGIAVHVTAGDQRSYMSYGRNAKAEPAATQTLAAFNSLGRNIEWRMDRTANGTLKPFATIVRWNTTIASDAEPVRGQMLVVTRLAPGAICHVGYVDASVNANANTLAQTISDERARKFRCGSDRPVVLGERGAAFSMP
jgi:hypothetical protein